MIICPNCGAQNDLTAKFCTTCGTKLIADVQPEAPVTPQQPVQPQQPQEPEQSQAAEPAQPTLTPEQLAAQQAAQAEAERQRALAAQQRAEQVAKLKESGRGFWDYIVDSWAHPSLLEGKKYASWYGVVSMVLWALFGAFAMTKMYGDTARTAVNSVNGFLNSMSGQESNAYAGPSTGGVFFKLLLLFAAGMLVFGAVGYGFRLLAQHDQINFWDYLNDLMHRANVNLILSLFVLLLTLIGINPGTAIFVMIVVLTGMTIFSLAFIMSIVLPKERQGFDNIYVAVLANIALFVALMIIIKVFGDSVVQEVMNSFRF